MSNEQGKAQAIKVGDTVQYLSRFNTYPIDTVQAIYGDKAYLHRVGEWKPLSILNLVDASKPTPDK